jgi:cobalt-zinc-cadmium efflux system outer membrane protein
VLSLQYLIFGLYRVYFMELSMTVVPLVLIYILAQNSYASAPCDNQISSVQDALQCADTIAPEIQKARLDLARSKLEIEAKGQWKNPDFTISTIGGYTDGGTQKETELGLGVPIELGGKIAARRALGEAGVKQAEASLYRAQANTRRAIFLGLHRLRQLEHELAIANESIATFDKLNRQYAERPGLSPEQKTSILVYKMAKGQYELKRTALIEELGQLDATFRVLTGRSSGQLKGILPKSPTTWPIVSGESVLGSPAVKDATASLSVAEADLGVAKSDAWPTLTVGPSFRAQKQPGSNGSLIGVSLGLPLPLFNLNGPTKAAADAAVSLAETSRSLEVSISEKERDRLLSIYKESVDRLKASLSHEEIEKSHHEVEGLFSRGIVPSALVIEAHRSYLDLETARNERERQALDALVSLYTLEGTILEREL